MGAAAVAQAGHAQRHLLPWSSASRRDAVGRGRLGGGGGRCGQGRAWVAGGRLCLSTSPVRCPSPVPRRAARQGQGLGSREKLETESEACPSYFRYGPLLTGLKTIWG
jgi:hypothetical protein